MLVAFGTATAWAVCYWSIRRESFAEIAWETSDGTDVKKRCLAKPPIPCREHTHVVFQPLHSTRPSISTFFGHSSDCDPSVCSLPWEGPRRNTLATFQGRHQINRGTSTPTHGLYTPSLGHRPTGMVRCNALETDRIVNNVSSSGALPIRISVLQVIFNTGSSTLTTCSPSTIYG